MFFKKNYLLQRQRNSWQWYLYSTLLGVLALKDDDILHLTTSSDRIIEETAGALLPMIICKKPDSVVTVLHSQPWIFCHLVRKEAQARWLAATIVRWSLLFLQQSVKVKRPTEFFKSLGTKWKTSRCAGCHLEIKHHWGMGEEKWNYCGIFCKPCVQKRRNTPELLNADA